MLEDDISPSDSPPNSRVLRFVWRWFPWAYDKKTALALAVLMVVTCATTFAALGLWTGELHIGPSFEDHPPGTNESGVVDGALLVEQHAVGVTSADYRIRMNISYEQENETQHVRRTYEHDVDEDVLLGNVTAPNIAYDVYNSPDQNATYYRQTRRGNNTTVAYQRSSRGESKFTARKFLRQRMNLFTTEPQGYTKLADGTRVREFTITGFNERADDVVDTANYSVNGSFVITKSGVIREYEMTLRKGANKTSTTVVQRESITVSRESIHINAPNWLSTAINETAPAPSPAESDNTQTPTTETTTDSP